MNERLATAGRLLHFREFVIAVALSLVGISIGVVALWKSLQDNSFFPVQNFAVQFESNTAIPRTLSPVHLSGHIAGHKGDPLSLFLFSQWVNRQGVTVTGPTVAGGKVEPGDYSTTVSILTPSLPPGEWRLVISGMVLHGSQSQSIGAVSTTKDAGDSDFLIVGEAD